MKKGDKTEVRQAESTTPRCNFCGHHYNEQVALLVASPPRLGPVVCICDQCVETCMEIIVDGFREAVTKGFRVAAAEQIEPAPSATAVAEALDEVLGSGSAPKSPPPDSLADPDNQATSPPRGRAAKIT